MIYIVILLVLAGAYVLLCWTPPEHRTNTRHADDGVTLPTDIDE